jgi:PKD repeat protein
MNTIYKTIKRNGLKALALGLLLTGSGWVKAQLSGTYTIGSGGSFSTFSSFASTFNSVGVSGPVTLNMISSTSEFSRVILYQHWSWPTTSTNKVTINGNGYTVSYSGFSSAPEVFLLDGADYFSFSGMTIRNTGTSSNIMGVRFTNNADNNRISSCNIEFSNYNSFVTSGGGAYVAFSNSTSLSNLSGASFSGGNGSFNVISNNLMRTTNFNSPGPFAGIFEVQNTSSYTSTGYDNTFRSNTIQNYYAYGINSGYSNGTQIVGNDLSRDNNSSGTPASTLYSLYVLYGGATNRAVRIDSNNVHDLPFRNATVFSSNASNWNIQMGVVTGTTTNPSSIKGNRVTNVMSASGGNLGIFTQLNNFCNIDDNIITNLRNNGTSSSFTAGYVKGIYCNGGNDYNIRRNTIRDCRPNANFSAIYCSGQSPTSYQTSIADNYIKNNISLSTSYSFWNMYGIYCNNGAWDVTRNTIDEMQQSGPYGYVYLFYTVAGTGNHTWSSNIATHARGGYYTYGFYSSANSTGEVLFKQNTLNFNVSAGFGWNYYNNFTYGFGTAKTTYEGNIFYDNTSYYWGFYYGTTNTRMTFTNNHIFAPFSGWGMYSYYPSSGWVYDYNTWRTSGVGGQVGDIYADPLFTNVGARDFRPREFMTQNNINTTSNAPKENNGKNRNNVKSDRGAVENFMDIQAVNSNLSVPSTVCAGWEQTVYITVKNLYTEDTAYNFNVGYTYTGGPKVSRVVTKKLLTNDTDRITFSVPIRINTVGNVRVAVFVDIPDDNQLNDSFAFNTIVKPAPGGGKYSKGTTTSKAFYAFSKPNDVTQVNRAVHYNVNAPNAYSKTTYWNGTGSSTGKDWTASVYAQTKGGTLLTGAGSILNHASSTNDLEVKFETSNTAYEDSIVTLVTKITDLNNGCDTFIKRDILIYPTIVPDFKYPSRICDGDNVPFDQASTVRSGSMEFFWNFGTGVAADTSNAPSPVFQFPKPGTYRVKMFASTLPYGFVSIDSVDIVVNPNPTVKFSKQNACEGQDLVFTNLTTPSTGVNSNWNWGNGQSKNDNNTTVKYRYTATGSYVVTLTANLNGCIGTATQRVYQFPAPKASYAQVAGTCDNDEYLFENKSTIASGTFGSYWNFGDNTYSTEEDTKKVFGTPGSKSVKLITTSVFGCKDSTVQNINVLESPKVSFVNTPACSRTATEFTNTTPTVGGAGGTVKSYSWNFGDGGSSSLESPKHSWSALGPKTITYNIDLMNGCKGSVTKTLSVGIQPKASFTAESVCLGKPMTFDNTSTWPQGDISWLWNFGDGTTSTSSKPVHTYNKAFGPNITLYATIAGGCTDSFILQTALIYDGPRTCDFTVNTDYAYGFRGVKLNPLNTATGVAGGQDKVNYKWIFQGGGTNNTSGVNAETQYDFQADGSYDVTMSARSTTAPFCECSITKKVVMNRASVKDFETTGVAVFPNPNNGNFNLSVKSNFGKNLNIVITNMSGAVVKQISTENNGLISINSGNLSDGVYMVRVSSGENTAVRRITISK